MSTPVQHPLGEHLPTCSGPENCAEYSAILNMTPTQYVDYINDSTARFAAIRAARAGTDTALTFRVSKPTSFEPPNPYERGLADLRTARATPASSFAERYAAERRAELEAEYAAAARSTPRPAPRRLTAAESAQYAPPDPYAAGLAKMRSNTR